MKNEIFFMFVPEYCPIRNKLKLGYFFKGKMYKISRNSIYYETITYKV